MAETDELKEVYKRWEQRSNPYIQNRNEHGSQRDHHYENMLKKGRDDWNKKFVAAPKHMNFKNRSKKYKHQSEDFVPLNTKLSTIAYFKKQPIVAPLNDKLQYYDICYRCDCMPKNDDIYKNFNRVIDLNRNNYRFIPSLLAYNCNIHRYPSLISSVCSSNLSNLNSDTFDGVDGSCEEIHDKNKSFMKSIIRTCKYNFSSISIRSLYILRWVISKVCKMVFSSILISPGQLEVLRKVKKENKTIIYVPSHFNIYNYFLLNYVLLCSQLPVSHFPNININFPFFTTFLKKIGVFFTKNYDNIDSSLFEEIIFSYIVELIKNGQCLGFFTESDSSKQCKILTYIVNAIVDNIVPDALVVPVSFSYENLALNKSYHDSEKNLLWCWWDILSYNYSVVKIDFGQPFSLDKYLNESQLRQYEKENDYESNVSPNNDSLPKPSLCSKYDNYKSLVQDLHQHLIADSCYQQAVMSTDIISMLLLYKHRTGVSLSHLIESFDWLKNELIYHRLTLGFCGNGSDIVKHALDLIDTCVSISEKDNSLLDDINSYDPFIKLNNFSHTNIELHKICKNLRSIFSVQSLLSVSLCYHLENDIWDNRYNCEQIKFNKNVIFQTAIDLANIFQFEFIYGPSCMTWCECFDKALEDLIVCGAVENIDDCPIDRTHKTLHDALSFEDELSDDEDDEISFQKFNDIDYYLRINEYTLDRLQFLYNILGPLLECYHVIVCYFEKIFEEKVAKKKIFEDIMLLLKSRVADHLMLYNESASQSFVENAIETFKSLNFIEEINVDDNFFLCRKISESRGLSHIVHLLNKCLSNNISLTVA